MIVVDSCGWIEFLTGGPLRAEYRPFVTQTEELAAPSIVVYEVYKHMLRYSDRNSAAAAVAQMLKSLSVPLTDRLAVLAAETSSAHKLPMAHAVVYATAQSLGAELATSDSHFEGLPGVVYIARNHT